MEKNPEKANEIFGIFLRLFQLHQMLWYLLEALSLVKDKKGQEKIEGLISKYEQITKGSFFEILNFDLEDYRENVNQILKKASDETENLPSEEDRKKDYFGKNFKKANLDGRNFSMALMIAANLEGCSLQGTNFLGADIRDANIKNTDLSMSVFLTQMQINGAKGNAQTKLPKSIILPTTWSTKNK